MVAKRNSSDKLINSVGWFAPAKHSDKLINSVGWFAGASHSDKLINSVGWFAGAHHSDKLINSVGGFVGTNRLHCTGSKNHWFIGLLVTTVFNCVYAARWNRTRTHCVTLNALFFPQLC